MCVCVANCLEAIMGCTTISIELVPSECVQECYVFGEVVRLTNVASLSRLTVLPCLD